MGMTFHQLCTNPPGKGSANIANRGRVISDLKQRTSGRNTAKGIELSVYRNGEDYLLFFRILSEEYKDLWYDTILYLSPPKDVALQNEKTISEYNVKFISNMPSFAFTYAYVASKQELIIDSFKDKFPDIFWTEAPKVRNPGLTMGFEKAILFCAFYLTEKRLQYISTLDNLSKGKPSMVVLKKKFMSFTQKMKDYAEKKKAHIKAQKQAGVKISHRASGAKLVKIKKTPIEKKTSVSSITASRSKKPKRTIFSSRPL